MIELPRGTFRVHPYLFYDDIDAAIGFLGEAFGFEKKLTVPGPDGSTSHGEVALDGNVVMMGSTQNPGATMPIKNPKDAGCVSASLYVYVDDVDAHFNHAKEAGAQIFFDPADQFWGDRIYAATDPEGHFWTFATRVREVSPEELAPPSQ